MNVTTLPMLYAAYPLYLVGRRPGGAAAPDARRCALALAHALAGPAVRCAATGGPRSGSIGLASPVAIYALDFWEHTLGLASMLWGVVWLVRACASRERARGCLAGLLFGAAATMRTEALVYLVVCGGIACLVVWR